jgi:hypothetical protein
MRGKISVLVSLCFLLTIAAMLSPPGNVWADSERTVGLSKRDLLAYEGYTLYKPLGALVGGYVYLINNAGNPVHKWQIPLPTRPGGEVFLRENGELVLTTDNGIYALDWEGNVAWEIYQVGMWVGHHECVELPNGNMLIPGFIEKTREEAIEAGFNVSGADGCPNGPLNVLRVDNIWELAPTDPQCGFRCGWEVVWNWNLWDHKIQDDDPSKPDYVENIADHPGKVDIGYNDPAGGICSQYIQGAWTFGRYNALGYNAGRDEIVMSASLFNEIQIIDHVITTEEAKGPAGDLIYRWGNPYAHGAGAPFVDANNRGDQKLSFQHRVQWIAPGLPHEGNILIFNNGTDWGDSSVLEIRNQFDKLGNYIQPGPRQPFGPAEPVWQYDEYDTPGSFFAAFISSSQRLPNGNTLINNGPAGYIFEVTPQGEKVWEYVNPAGGAEQGGAALGLYRAWRYAPDFPAFIGKDLTPGDPLETYPISVHVDIDWTKCPNELLGGGIRIAILGTADFDVTKIDPESILLEGFKPRLWRVQDVGRPATDGGDCACPAGGPDGYKDLGLVFYTYDIMPALSAYSNGDQIQLRLTGNSEDGWFLGKDCATVNLIPR